MKLAPHFAPRPPLRLVVREEYAPERAVRLAEQRAMSLVKQHLEP